MAGKKNIDEVVETEETPVVETPKKKATKQYFTIPYDKDEESMYVSVNGKNYLIQRDREVLLPTEVIEVIKNSLKAEKEAREYAKKKENEFKEAQKAVQFI